MYLFGGVGLLGEYHARGVVVLAHKSGGERRLTSRVFHLQVNVGLAQKHLDDHRMMIQNGQVQRCVSLDILFFKSN